ncbi:MAG TPA: uracil phosphoribosyltransferase, partial [Candidatus Sulfomarinibacteraceae bacterium]|nr:uracil phosphoribosyltransferase [Candidatus Sulfomarinibacteraceae bacterium]
PCTVLPCPAMGLHLVEHPLLHDIMARLRDRETSSDDFRSLAYRISTFLVAEATRDLPTRACEVRTPLETTTVYRLDARVVVVPVLRAGIGMLQAFLDLVPKAQVGYFGLERDEETAEARCYYEKVPKDLGSAVVFVIDPMLATGGSAAKAIEGLEARGATNVRLVSIVAAPEGVGLLAERTPDTLVFTAALDRGLSDRKFILPGLGDFGDRLYGT